MNKHLGSTLESLFDETGERAELDERTRELPFLNSATKEAYELGYRAGKATYQRRAFAMAKSVRIWRALCWELTMDFARWRLLHR